MFLLDAMQNYFRYKQAVTELQRLSDRELADIGMTRSEIRKKALQKFI